MYKFQISYKVNEDKWDTNLKKKKYSTFFQSAHFLNIQTKNRIPVYITIFYGNEIKCQAGLVITKTFSPYSTNKLNKFTKFISKFGNRITWISGPIIHEEKKENRRKIIQTFIAALNEISEKNNIVIIDGYTHAEDELIDQDILNEFEKNGFRNEYFTTFILDLSRPIEEIWRNVAKKARNDVTRAERRNVTVKEIVNYEDFKDFRNLIKNWGKTKGMDIKDQKEVIEKDWRLYQKGLQHFFVAYEDNKIISGLRVGTFNKIAYTHQVLSTYSKATSLGGSILTWYAVEWAKNKGMRVYDFSGVKSPPKDEKKIEKHNAQWKGLTEYKKKWGGKELQYSHLIKTKKDTTYKIFRLLSKPDFLYREYKRKHFQKPIKKDQ